MTTTNGSRDIWKQISIALGSALLAVLVAIVVALPAVIRRTAPYIEDRKHISETLKYHDNQLDAIRKTLAKIEARVHTNQIMLIRISSQTDMEKTLKRAGEELGR